MFVLKGRNLLKNDTAMLYSFNTLSVWHFLHVGYLHMGSRNKFGMTQATILRFIFYQFPAITMY